MITYDKIYGQKPEEKKVEPEPIDPSLPWSFVLYEAGIGSRVLGVGRDRDEMYRNAAENEKLDLETLKAARHLFAVEQIPEAPDTFPQGMKDIEEGRTVSMEAALTKEVNFDEPTLLEKRRAAMARARAARQAKREVKE